MLVTTNRYATECTAVDDDVLWHSMGNPHSMPKDQLPQFLLATPSGADGKGHDAIDEVYALTLEYDGTLPIERFVSCYKHLRFLLFTTSSHTPERHKYRVIIWMERPVKQCVLVANRHILLDYFPEHDPMSVSVWQSFPNRLNSDYQWRVNPGMDYDWDMVVERAEIKGLIERAPGTKATVQLKLNCLGTPLGTSRPDLYKQILDKEFVSSLSAIPQYQTGGRRYAKFFSLICRLRDATVGYDMAYSSDTIRQLILAHTNDAKRQKMLDSLLQGRP